MTRSTGRARARTLATLGLLSCALPANLAVTGLALAASAVRRPDPPPAPAARRTVLLSGGKMTKALALARAFHGAGHRVVLVESARYRLTGHRFSRAVDAFHVVPDSREAGYAEALRAVVEQEGVDVYVPVCSPASSRHDAEARAVLDPLCEVVHVGPQDLDRVDDKEHFARLAASLGLAVPESHRITDPQQVADFDFGSRPHRFILKNLDYDPVNRLDLTLLPLSTPEETAAFARSKPISPERPWVLQELVEGTEYCTHGTVREGRLTVWVCCESSAFQVNYDHVEHPAIEAWVRHFSEQTGITGQLSFDFIEQADGTVKAIECNPRTHSAITLLTDHPRLAAAYLGEAGLEEPVRPAPGTRPTYWTYQEVWRLLRRPVSAPQRLRVLREGRDAVFDVHDPLPFLLLHHLQVPSLLLGSLRRGASFLKIDFNIGKLVEAGGD